MVKIKKEVVFDVTDKEVEELLVKSKKFQNLVKRLSRYEEAFNQIKNIIEFVQAGAVLLTEKKKKIIEELSEETREIFETAKTLSKKTKVINWFTVSMDRGRDPTKLSNGERRELGRRLQWLSRKGLLRVTERYTKKIDGMRKRFTNFELS